MAGKYVYFFGNGKAEGKGNQKDLLGGKGAGLAEMTHIGLPVPAGFTISTQCCEHYYANDRSWPRGLDKQVREAIKKLEKACKKSFGDRQDPLLVSVRSGAAISMPGMMETILNLGLNDASVEGLARASGNRRFALDAYRRLIMMYGATAKGVNREHFDEAFEALKEHYTRPRLAKPAGSRILDTDVNEEELQSLIQTFKELYQQHTGEEFPQKPYDQLTGSIDAVFNSWTAPKAVTYRRVEKLANVSGTAVNVQQMVFGNMGEDSGTGVCFTRDPGTGVNEFYGDLLMNAQGEDVVAGVRTPLKLDELARLDPGVYTQLEAVRVMLEVHYKDMQDLEFTVERGKLYMLQCRTGKRSAVAAFKIAVDHATKPLITRAEANRLVKKKVLSRTFAQAALKPVITKEQAICRIKEVDVERLFHPVIDPGYPRDRLAQQHIGAGINAVAGAACGRVVFTAADSEDAAARNEKVILVRKETSPEDVGGMHAAQGILTATGGKTSHAAVVARGWGKCCIVGCDALQIDLRARTMTLGNVTIREGETITLDGGTGDVYRDELPLVMPQMPAEYDTLMSWCDARRRLKVRTNADTPADAVKALEMGAEGIGLCRTEHMFFETEQRRLAMQEAILAHDEADRRRTLAKLLPYQRDDFTGIFEAMDGKPVTIRLIDPPLHEFLPRSEEDIYRLSSATRIDVGEIRRRSEQLHEANPMLGHRGCRLCITYPEILEMQVTAIIEAAVACRRNGVTVLPEIMIPLTIEARELARLVQQTREVADRILAEAGEKLDYLVGTMIETPRAALLADEIAQTADFFSFGTNDLTQTTLALSRDDAGRFLPSYIDPAKGAIFPHDPFTTIDVPGVGLLMRWAMERGRGAKPRLKCGVCGEHGGDGASVAFFDALGLDYVSCSPYRVPVARLAAAQAMLADGVSSPLRLPAGPSRAAAKLRPGQKAAKARRGGAQRSTAGRGRTQRSKRKTAGEAAGKTAGKTAGKKTAATRATRSTAKKVRSGPAARKASRKRTGR